MRFIKALSIFLIGLVIFSACQKELSYETSGPASGSLVKDSVGDCGAAVVSGVYVVDTAVNASNFVTLSVNVINPGTYYIRTDSTNGYWFKDSATFAAPGIQSVQLKAYGKPVAPGTDTKVVMWDSSICTFDVVVFGGGGGGTTAAVYTLGATGTACTGATTAGTYTSGTAMGAGNTATINVNVTTPGTYTITTTAVNGVTFSKTGVFTAAGAQTVVLTASGTPTAAGTFSYPLAVGGSTCSFSVTYATGGGSGTGAAVYTLGATGTACTGATTAGTYTAGTAMAASNTATVNVNVTTVGTYTISTTAVNGVTFSKSGTFTTTGAQTVVLTASGTPTAAGSFSYPLTGGSSTCNFSVTYANGGTQPLRDTLTMTVDGTTYNSIVDTVIIRTQPINGVNAAIMDIIAYNSTTAATNDTFRIELVVLNATTIAPGSYNVNSLNMTTFTGHYLYGEYSPGATPTTWYSNESDPTIPAQNPGFNMTISSITSTRVRGTFNGRLYTQTSAGQGTTYKTIANGVFALTR